MNGCIEEFSGDINGLAKLVKIKDGQKGIDYRSLCVDKGGGGVYYKEVLYKSEDFFAYKIKDGLFYDIKQKTLKDLV